MHRIRSARSATAALAALSLTAGLAAAHALPSASDGGINTGREASGKQVPLGVDASVADRNGTNASENASSGPPPDTHGFAVSAAAKGGTDAETQGDFANHGAFVRTIAVGWGQATSAAHQKATASGAAANHTPTAAAKGLAHKP
jgi:hypothetical protein